VDAGNSIFTGTVTALGARPGASTSLHSAGIANRKRYHCQPDLAIAGVTGLAARRR
jgi:hypothetical protein